MIFESILVVIAILVVAVVLGALVINKLIHICAPNEVLIFSGTQRRVGKREVGYRLVQGGRGIRVPLLERVDTMDLTNMIIDLRVLGAYSRGGIPLNVEGVANVKISSTEPTIANAIERFLGKPRSEIIAVARETLEGNLRGVLATLTPEEVNQDRVKFAESLLSEADHDLKRLGLELDTLKIQNVSDDKGYLDSIGRKQTAGLLMKSRIAEAENQALAAERAAHNLQTQEMAKIDAEISMARADANRRIIDARTRKDAMVAEQRGMVTAALARAQGEVKVQEARLDQVRYQLLADQIRPAEAKRRQMEEAARGHAAQIVEQGKATASALRDISNTWQAAGESGRQIFVAQKLNTLVAHLMSTVGNLNIDKVTFMDKALTDGGSNLAMKAAVTSEQLKSTLGVDLPSLLNKIAGKANGNGAAIKWLDNAHVADVS